MSLGSNVKITAPESTRAAQSALYAGVFGCERLTPNPGMDVFRFASGACVGVEFVADSEALTPAQAKRGAWLEFLVDDIEATVGALAAQGIAPFSYVDVTHHYFQAPGGQVFRLAAR